MRIVPPKRVAHSYVQHLFAEPARVFPLLCPVRETEWVEGWDPELVITDSGFAERDCVFRTGDPDAIWTVIDYRPPHAIEFLKVAPELTVGRISIVIEPDGEVECRATVTYQHTALTPAGEAFIAGFTEEKYLQFMQEWEDSLNRYLAN